MFITLFFCDATGTVVHIHGEGQPWPDAQGQALSTVLGLDEQDSYLTRDPPHTLPCSPPALGGKHMLARLAPLPDTLAPRGGFVVCLTPALCPGLAETERPTSAQTSSALPALVDYTVFNAVFHDARDAIILIDSTLTILVANRRAQKVYAPDADLPLTNRNFLTIIHPDDQESITHAISKLNVGASWRRPLSTVSGGTVVPVKLRMRCLSTEGARLYQIMLRDLRQHMALEQDLEKTRQTVAGMNIALKQVLRTVEEEKQELKEELVQQVREEVLPAVDRLVREDSPLVREAFQSALKEKIADLSDTQTGQVSLPMVLTPREMDICRLIQQGWQGKAIAEELYIAFETLQSHRKNIRQKLGLKGSSTSLSAFLQNHAPL